MKSLREISEAASKIAEALEGFDESDIVKAFATARALRGIPEPKRHVLTQSADRHYAPTFAPPSQPPTPSPYGGFEITGIQYATSSTANVSAPRPLGTAAR